LQLQMNKQSFDLLLKQNKQNFDYIGKWVCTSNTTIFIEVY